MSGSFNIVQDMILPAALFGVMVTVGMELTRRDFRDLVAAPKSFLIGSAVQLTMFPAIAILVLWLVPLPVATAVGLAIVAACPSGGFSNVLTLLGRGHLALSISLTTMSSVLAVLTLPLVLAFALSVADVGAETGESISIPLGPTLTQLFAVVLLPVAIGMWARATHPAWVQRNIDRAQQGAQYALYGVVVLLAIQDWQPFSEGIESSIPLAAVMFALSAGGGFFISSLFLTRAQAFTVAIETGTRNVGLSTLVAISVLDRVDWAAFGAVYIAPASLLGFAAALAHRRAIKMDRRRAAERRGQKGRSSSGM
ncbi:Sodium-dependent transporter [Candidatus Phaeomarinobacter ectocarpi]|uniref:Sodium-dependent transporter n=1 Tax=Candidatus Phaeomarinibacter ectocarpi TaxID=1458461 RepID=X5MMG0_9HYPH|nr:bile acid:sodium symporter [Candidatus Phaeomarinobacter ectocarpi]CDO59191.1 Sodium-dependent transporter [Candidatus Phaeomarinobacter ectocarpi]